MSEAYARICAWDNLFTAWRKASRGKRGSAAVATFEAELADRLLELQDELLAQRYRPGPYVHFHIQSGARSARHRFATAWSTTPSAT